MNKKKKKHQLPDEEAPAEMNTVYTNEMTGAIPANPPEDDEEEM